MVPAKRATDTSPRVRDPSNMGLVSCIESYDLDKGVKFETYAVWRIKGAVLRLPDFYGPNVDKSFLHGAFVAATTGGVTQFAGRFCTLRYRSGYPTSTIRCAYLLRLSPPFPSNVNCIPRFFQSALMLDIDRFKDVLSTDPAFSNRDAVYYHLAESLYRTDKKAEALPYYERLLREFEKSQYLEETQKRVAELKGGDSARK